MSKLSTSPCQYGREEKIRYNYDDIKDTYDVFECPLPSEIDSKYCCFHDPERSKFTNEEINAKFLDYMGKPFFEKLKTKRNSNDDNLYCVGFFLNQEQINIIPRKKYNKIYFNYAKFCSGIAFSQGIFPSLDFSNSEFHKYVNFTKGIFSDVIIKNAKFIEVDYIHFYHSDFDKLDFSSSGIYGADFQFAVFHGEVNLSGIFEGEVNFTKAVFHEKANIGIEFKGNIIFYLSIFYKYVKFSSNFHMGANFGYVEFHEGASFKGVTFFERVRFNYAKFLKSQTIFSNTIFKSYCSFSHSIFEYKPLFDDITCTMINFEYADFYDANFINWKINSQFYDENINFYNREYILNNQSEFLTFLKSKIILDPSTSYKIKHKLGNSLDDNFEHFGENTILIDEGVSNSLLIFYKNNRNEIHSFVISDIPPINFTYAIFRNRTRFIECDLKNFSFKGVNLSNVEFHNVNWLKQSIATKKDKKSFMKRIHNKIFSSAETIIIDSLMDNLNYKNVSYIYNQLRKNFESDLRFSEASDFFINEMESMRWGLWRGKSKEKSKSIGYGIYRYLALYGESIGLPLIFWTPIIIVTFFIIRYFFNIYSIECNSSTLIDSMSSYFNSNIINSNDKCNFFTQFIDSIAAYFQVPRSNEPIDIIERIISAPILGTAFIALKRRFERKY